MYHHATSNPLSRLRFFVVCTALLLGAVKAGYGQRVYGSRDAINAEYVPPTLLLGESGVENRARAIDANLNNFSRLRLEGLPLLNAEAWQSIRFPIDAPPLPSSPIFIKFTPPAAVLTLLSGISVVRTFGGDDAIQVGQEYADSELLTLLGVLSPNQPVEFSMPVNVNDTHEFDGIRLKIGGLLAIGAIAEYYYAFYITPPQIDNDEIYRCNSESGQTIISNFQTGYTYRLYTAEIDGTEKTEAATTSSTLTIPPTIADGEYWVEARENDIYPSARTKITVLKNSVTGGTITGTQTLCANITPAQLSETTASTGTDPLAYQWQSKTTGGYTDVPDATSVSYAPPTLSETTMYRRVTTSTANGVVCEAFSNEITITVNPVPSISLNHSSIDACQDDNTIDFPYNTVTNAPTSYSIDWNNDAIAMGFQDVSNEAHTFLTSGGNIPIVVPPDATPGTYHGILKIQNSDGCESNGQGLIVNILPKPPAPALNIDPHSQY